MTLARVQGIYYIVTGLWPLLHMSSFEAVTGRKTDKWLVKTSGLMIAGVGLSLLLIDTEAARVLGLTIATIVAATEAYYSLKGTLSIVYFIESLIEFVFILIWILTALAA